VVYVFAAALALAILQIVKLRRQVSTLHYCWLCMSDGYEKFTRAALEDCILSVEDALAMNPPRGEGSPGGPAIDPAMLVSDGIREGNGAWGRTCDAHLATFRRQGLRRRTELEIKSVVLEDWW
jgi:hypothetical protein